MLSKSMNLFVGFCTLTEIYLLFTCEWCFSGQQYKIMNLITHIKKVRSNRYSFRVSEVNIDFGDYDTLTT